MTLTRSSVHIDAALSNFSVGFMANPAISIASDAIPMTAVKKESDLFFTFERSHFHRDDAKPRAPGTEAAQGDFAVSTGSYSVQPYAFKAKLPWRIRDNSDSQLAIDKAMVEFVTQVLRIKRERAFTSVASTAANWAWSRVGVDATPSAGTEVLNLVNGGSIIELAQDMHDAIEEGTGGLRGNLVIMGTKIRNRLVRLAEILERIKYTGGGDGKPRMITDQVLADILEVEKVITPRAFYATSPAGTAEASVAYDRIWPEDTLLMLNVGSAQLMDPSSMKQFSLAQYDGVDAKGAAIQRYEERKLQADWYEGEIAVDFRITNSRAGAIVTDLVDETDEEA